MFKIIRYGIAILSLALAFVTGAANARSYPCTSVTTGTENLMAARCDVSFSALPAFASPMCYLTIESGVYSITNNTRVPVKITFIQLKVNDALPTSASAIVAAPINSCVVGNSLAPGASCNIQVNLLPLAIGVYNRVLQVGVNTRQGVLNGPPITVSVISCTPIAPTYPDSPFTALSACTILGASTVTNTGPSAVNGNVCLSPGSSVVGFPAPGTITNGTIHIDDATANDAQGDLTTGYTALQSATCPPGAYPGGHNLSGINLGYFKALNPLPPGVYCFSSSAQLTGALVLSGAGQYIFQIASTLTTAAASSVTLTNGATAADVFWQIGSSATIGTGTQFQGVIAAQASITLNTGAQLIGWALARTGAVTLADNLVNPTL